MKRTILIGQLAFVCIVSSLSLHAQGTPEPCTNYGFTSLMFNQDGRMSTGVNGREFDLFTLFKLGASDIPDCWVYKSPNNLDHVIVPGPWTATPNSYRRSVIKANFEAMIQSRAKYSEYGRVQRKWFFLLSGKTIDQDAQAYDLRSECWMRSVDWTDERGTLDDFKQVVAHEAGHCFQIENFDGPDYSFHNWLDESNADYMSALVYPANNGEHYSAEEFDLDKSPFRQAYNANVLLADYANRYSTSETIEFVRKSFKVSSRQLVPYYKSIGFDKILHAAYFRHYKGEIEDSGGGFFRREREVELKKDPVDLIPGVAPPVTIDTIQSQRLSVYALNLPAGYDLSIKAPVNSSAETFFSILANDQEIQHWTEAEEIDGECDSPVRVIILASHLNPNKVTGTKISYELKERLGCCEPGMVITANPDENELDGKFYFDYYIESEVMAVSDGETNRVKLNYYVNSKDGSMLMPPSFFLDNFGTAESGGTEAHAAIWLANGQMVGYVDDKHFGQKRAITIDVNQTRADVMGPRAVNPAELLREGRSSGVPPAALPMYNVWYDRATGYAYYRPERYHPDVKHLMTAYISNETTNVVSPMSSFGFMVGFIKDQAGRSKNLVYTRYDLENGDMMEAHLYLLEKRCMSFDGNGYKKMTLGASTGALATMTEGERQGFADDQLALQAEMLALLAELNRCGDNETCINRVSRQMKELETRIQNNIYDLPENSDLSGNAGTAYQEKERAIRDRMLEIDDELLAKELRCERLARQDANCGGCVSLFLERCRKQYEEILDRLREQECQLAKLKGMEDMMEDCD